MTISPTRTKQTRKVWGFSLIEILLVITLIALFTSMMAISLQGRSDTYRIKSAARELAATISLVRNQAILKRRTTLLFIDLDEQVYWYRHLTDEEEKDNFLNHDPGDLHQTPIPHGVRIKDIAQDAFYTIENGQVVCRAFPSGRINQFMIHFELEEASGENTLELSMEINPLTGRISWFDTYKEYKGPVYEDI